MYNILLNNCFIKYCYYKKDKDQAKMSYNERRDSNIMVLKNISDIEYCITSIASPAPPPPSPEPKGHTSRIPYSL